jgi:hypothetical protein
MKPGGCIPGILIDPDPAINTRIPVIPDLTRRRKPEEPGFDPPGYRPRMTFNLFVRGVNKVAKCRFSIGCSSEIGENEGSQSLSITPGDPG